jgi:hypothetical protein
VNYEMLLTTDDEFSEILISVEQKIVKLAEKNKIYNAKMICYTMN